MMRWLCILICTAILSPSAMASSLKEVPDEFRQDMAYVLVEVGNPDEGPLKGQITLARYDNEVGDLLGTGKSHLESQDISGARELTRRHLVKGKMSRLYLLELQPGLWVMESAGRTSFSLGSNSMQLAAGTVSDLGYVSIYTDFAEGEEPMKATVGNVARMMFLGALLLGPSDAPPERPVALEIRERTEDDLPLPAGIGEKLVPVEWAGEVRFGNHLGGLVNRMGGRKAREAVRQASEEDARSVQILEEKAPLETEEPSAHSEPDSQIEIVG